MNTETQFSRYYLKKIIFNDNACYFSIYKLQRNWSSIFIMKTFSVLTQTMAEVSRGQEGQSSIKRRVTVALVSMLTLQQPSDRVFIPREKIKPANPADGINGCLQIVHRVSL